MSRSAYQSDGKRARRRNGQLTMSSYFFGGFSAYLIVPSGRQSNHSGCSLIQGWSGEHWMAKSSAISRPCVARRRHQPGEIVEACRARGGWRRGRPPPSRWRRGCRDRPARASGVLFLPLRWVAADRVDRREIEHVEAEVADVGQLARSRRRRCRGGRDRRTCERGISSYQALNAARFAVDGQARARAGSA